ARCATSAPTKLVNPPARLRRGRLLLWRLEPPLHPPNPAVPGSEPPRSRGGAARREAVALAAPPDVSAGWYPHRSPCVPGPAAPTPTALPPCVYQQTAGAPGPRPT